MRLTREQAAIIGAYTGITCGPFSDIQQYADRVLGMATCTHDFASRKLCEDLRKAAKDDFIAICALE